VDGAGRAQPPRACKENLQSCKIHY
jgi:hypothetical protein